MKAEERAWNLLLKDSPVILTQADLEPQCHVTKGRTGSIVGILVDNRVLSAPLLREPVTVGARSAAAFGAWTKREFLPTG